LPKCSIPRQKINVDNKTRFRYLNCYWFRLIDASICWAAAEADTQFVFFDSSALKKQLLIFLSISTSALGPLHAFCKVPEALFPHRWLQSTLIDSDLRSVTVD
jgi:hypothetical protein